MILVTGANGLLGSHLLFNLLNKGLKVRALIRNEKSKGDIKKVFGYYSDEAETVLEKIEWAYGDVTNWDEVAASVEGITQVYHTAAMVSFHKEDFSAMQDVNICGTENIVNACLDHPGIRLCFVSSIASLGSMLNGNPIDEETYWDQEAEHSNYAITKYYAEMEVWRGFSEGLKGIIVNPSIILGPGNWERSTSGIFKLAHEGLSFYTEGINGFVDVRDACECMVGLMNSELTEQRFILNADNFAYKEVFDRAAREFGKKPPSHKASSLMTEVAWRLDAIRCFFTGSKPTLTRLMSKSSHAKTYYSNQKVSEMLGYTFRPLSETIRDFCSFFLADRV